MANTPLKFLDMKDRTKDNKPKSFTTAEYKVEKKTMKSGRVSFFAIATAPSGCKAYRVVANPNKK